MPNNWTTPITTHTDAKDNVRTAIVIDPYTDRHGALVVMHPDGKVLCYLNIFIWKDGSGGSVDVIKYRDDDQYRMLCFHDGRRTLHYDVPGTLAAVDIKFAKEK